MKKTTIIVAAGSGSRMGIKIPKQYILLNGRPLLMHTIQRFFDHDPTMSIVVVLPENEDGTWERLINDHSFSISHTVVKGSNTRFHSVTNGLSKITGHCLLAIHDGVRPLCSPSLIGRCFEEAEKFTNAIPAIRITETVREIINGNNQMVDREKLRLIQTPQCFDSELLKKAYQNCDHDNFTDDAGVFEHDGNKIHLVEGEKNNIKITEPADLIFASPLEKELFSYNRK